MRKLYKWTYLFLSLYVKPPNSFSYRKMIGKTWIHGLRGRDVSTSIGSCNKSTCNIGTRKLLLPNCVKIDALKRSISVLSLINYQVRKYRRVESTDNGTWKFEINFSSSSRQDRASKEKRRNPKFRNFTNISRFLLTNTEIWKIRFIFFYSTGEFLPALMWNL